MEEEKKNILQKLASSSTFLVAIVPLASYGILYVFESKFLGYYGVPSQYINFELHEIFIVSFALISASVPIYFFIDQFYQVSNRLINSHAQFLVMFTGAFIIICLIGSFIQIEFHQIGYAITFAVLGLVIFGIIFLIPLLSKEKIPYWERLENHLLNPAKTKEPSSKSIIDLAIEKFGKELVALLLLSYFFINILGQLGTLNAYSKTRYNVIKTTPECAVIYTKTDLIICTTFDRKNKQIEAGYQIYENSDLRGIKILSENIGPLHLKPTPTRTPLPTFTPTITNTPLPTKTPVPTLTATP